MRFRWGRSLVSCFCSCLFLVPFLRAQGVSPQQSLTASDSKDDEALEALSLDSENLHAQQPLLSQKDKAPGFTREILQVEWRTGDRIYLYVMLPEGVEKPPVVLYLYSYPSETDRFRDDAFCGRLTRGGVAAVGFVSALTGQRYHDLPAKQWFVSELPYSLTTSVHDVQMILNYLAKRGDVDMNRVGMFGQGSGGAIAVLSAAVDPRIKAIDLLNPWGDWPDWFAKSARVPDAERPDYLTKSFLDSVAPLDPVKWLPKLKSRSVRIVDAMDDPITPPASKKQIEAAAAAPSAQVTEYDKTNAMYETLSGGKLFQWIKDQLQPDGKSPLVVEQHP